MRESNSPPTGSPKMAQHTEKQPHGKPHQINIYVTDRESSITAKGQHKRCIVFQAGNLIEVRVDDVTGDQDLPWPSLDEVRAVALHPEHRMHGHRVKLQHVETEEQENCGSVPGIQASRWYRFAQVH